MENCCEEPNTPNHKALKSLMKIFRLHRLAIERRVRQTGVYRSQHQILMFIAANPDATQKEIARLHETSPATIAVSLKKLEKAGYIRRVVDQEDNRCNRLQVTEKGQLVVNQSHIIFRQIEEEMFAGFSQEDFRDLDQLLGRINGNINRMNGNINRMNQEAGDISDVPIEGREELHETV